MFRCALYRKRVISFFITCLLYSGVVLADAQQHFNAIKHDTKALYVFLEQFPKGGELHYHLAGSVSPEKMLALAAHGDYCLDEKTLTVFSSKEKCNGLSISQLHSNPTVYDKVIKAWTMQGVTEVKDSGHDHFFATFPKFVALADEFQSQLLADIVTRAASQQELYMEVIAFYLSDSQFFAQKISKDRAFERKRAILLADPTFQKAIDNIAHDANTLLPRTQQVLECHKNETQPACTMVVKFQYFVRRTTAIDEVFAQALAGFEAAGRSNEIVAINLVEAEDAPVSQRDYRQHMEIFNYLHSLYPRVHIALHAGELKLTGQTSPDIRDAIMIGKSERIGHGVDINVLGKDKDLVDYMAKNLIPVEINLSSNHAILDVHGQQHPLSFYNKHHVPIVLSTDDEGILGTNLTNEFVKAVQEQQLDYPMIKAISRNALTYSFLSGKSIWSDAVDGGIVPECKHLSSDTCQRFIASSEKAKLQWQLENKLQAFEKSYTHSH